MGRRIKQPPEFHRQAIALAAEQLFLNYGIVATSMDEIAKHAGYSKATLYVYFSSKREIIGALTLKSMHFLLERLTAALGESHVFRRQYDALCWCLTCYQQEYPLYFELALADICVDLENPETLEVEREIFEVGEQLNECLGRFVAHGMAQGLLRHDLVVKPTIFAFWSALAGLVKLAANKKSYVSTAMQMEQQEFLQYGFDMLYRSIQK